MKNPIGFLTLIALLVFLTPISQAASWNLKTNVSTSGDEESGTWDLVTNKVEGPDLTIQDLYQEEGEFVYVIANKGTESVEEDTAGYTSISVNDDLLGMYYWPYIAEDHRNFLNAGEFTESVYIPTLIEDVTKIEICVDSDDTVAEYDETNNCQTFSPLSDEDLEDELAPYSDDMINRLRLVESVYRLAQKLNMGLGEMNCNPNTIPLTSDVAWMAGDETQSVFQCLYNAGAEGGLMIFNVIHEDLNTGRAQAMRWELPVLVFQMLGQSVTDYAAYSLDDLAASGLNSYVNSTIETAYNLDVMNGFEDGTFKPYLNIHRTELLKVLMEFYKAWNADGTTDEETDYWDLKAVKEESDEDDESGWTLEENKAI